MFSTFLRVAKFSHTNHSGHFKIVAFLESSGYLISESSGCFTFEVIPLPGRLQITSTWLRLGAATPRLLAGLGGEGVGGGLEPILRSEVSMTFLGYLTLSNTQVQLALIWVQNFRTFKHWNLNGQRRHELLSNICRQSGIPVGD